MKKITVSFLLCVQCLFSQNYTEYHTGSTADISTNQQPGVCLMGGAVEHDEAMKWFLNKADGGDVVVLRSSGSNGYNDYFYTDLGVTINSITTFVIYNEAGAIDPYVLQRVANAEAVWFAGGDQYDYVNYFKDNALEDVLNNFINVKQGVIGGTSAGMAILGSSYFSAQYGTITSDVALSNPYHPRVALGHDDFLDIPYLNQVITDSHYDDPDRRGRHSVFLARIAQDYGTRSFGIACNEYTAVCVGADGKAYVYGDYPNYQEFAYFLQANCVEDFEPETCIAGTPLTWNRNSKAIKVYKIPGTNDGVNYFDLSDWETASGGEWQNWSITNGIFTTAVGLNPQCTTCPATACFVLPSNNFEITVTNETCPNKDNGQLSIGSVETHNFVTTIKGTDYSFTNDLTVDGLAPGTYDFCIEVKGENYEQCFVVEVIEGTTVSGKSSVTSGKASIEIGEGTAPFTIYVNGKQTFETNSPIFNVDVLHGDLIEVKTAKTCEGTFSKAIDLFQEMIAYPNPTIGKFEIAVPIYRKEVVLELYTLNSQLISKETYPVIYGKVELSLENQPSAVYLVKVYLETPMTLKMIKQ